MTLAQETWGFQLIYNKAYCLLIFRILRHNDVITILYWTYEFSIKLSDLRSRYQTQSVCWISTHNLKGELQGENKLFSNERALKMLENDIYIYLSLESVKPFSSYWALKLGQGITKGESPYFRNFRTSSVIWGSSHWKWRHKNCGIF